MTTRAKPNAPARMGRPPLVEGETKGRIFSIRLSLAEREEVEQAAIRAGASSASDWARAALLAAARAAHGSDQHEPSTPNSTR